MRSLVFHLSNITNMGNSEWKEWFLHWLFFIMGTIPAISGLPMSGSDAPKGFGTAKHVLILGTDGFGSLYMENATHMIPNIALIMKNGAHTFRARNRNPAVSAPNWGAILTGLTPEETGILDNDWSISNAEPKSILEQGMPPVTGAGRLPSTLWHIAKEQNPSLTTAVVHSWKWIETLSEKGVVDWDVWTNESDANATQVLINLIENHQPNLMFIHFDTIDEGGHHSYWGSDFYYYNAQMVDGYIGKIMQALDSASILDQTMIIVVADHGGYGKSHGAFNQANMFVPIIIQGPGITPGQQLSRYVKNIDLVPTALNALGLRPTEYMSGKILEEMYPDTFQIRLNILA
eukprot:comp12701_c0_seq1/m.7798 comp12701_c0_seq1/g.7798  ORF comp12701_c0_seq1/g.7798 comp12701_c0_seq1/m.7798 type:complete len:347 (-) comp12701_c0_seq1:18-1058(-)